jgi:hypothetical protein
MEESINKKIRDDLIIFKNDTLKDLKQTERTLIENYKNTASKVNERIENFKRQFTLFNDKIIEMTSFLDSLRNTTNDIKTLSDFKSKSEITLQELDFRLNILDKECHDSLFNISNILKNSVIYPGIIGNTAKFKTFHSFIDFVLNHISNMNLFKDRITKEVSDNKIKHDNNYEKLKTNCDSLYDKMKTIINKEIELIKEKNNSQFNLFEDKFHNYRIEIAKCDVSIKNIEQFINSIKEKNKELDIKEGEISIKLNNLNQMSYQNKSDIISLREKYYSLSNHFKQLKLNAINNDNRENNEINLVNDNNNNQVDLEKIPFEELSSSQKELIKLKNKKASGLNSYIKGKINYDQLQNIKKINYKSVEAFKSNLEEENKAKKFYYYSEKSKSSHGFPLFKEETKMLIQKKGNIKRNINKIKIENNNNSCNNTLKNNLNIDNYSNINTFSPTIDSNNKIQNITYKNISLNIEGSEIFNINQKNRNSKKYKHLIENVKTILNKNNNGAKIFNGNGYPKIMTNQGERIIISAHPVYHRHKFSKKEAPDIFSLNKNIQKIFSGNRDNTLIADDNKNTNKNDSNY